ncbi:MAG: DUF2293 domain-containing protein [Bryobacterales bacterium]|nr:DUF2293 domain-containing protein [Bryobacterales bacterium]
METEIDSKKTSGGRSLNTPKEKLEHRVAVAAEAALAHHNYVSAIDVLTGIGWLQHSNLEAWRRGQAGPLEQVIQTNLNKITLAMKFFRAWASDKGLKPSETRYVRRTRGGSIDLQFSTSGDRDIERNYRTHYVSPVLSEQKQRKLQEKLEETPRAVIFQVVRDSECSECGTEIFKESFLMMEAGQPLCLACAQLDDLEFLPAGNTALTRRATKFSSKVATVVRFSRSRNRYERQGILAEPAAIEKAEASCEEDAEERAIARVRGAERRQKEDRLLVEEMSKQIAALFPRCPRAEVQEIAKHTAQRGSGRVGRSAAGRKLEEQALTLAVRAAVRHRHTNYDELLGKGVDRVDARDRVYAAVETIIDAWRG